MCPKDELLRLTLDLERQMKAAAKNLEFERAALLRDQVVELRKQLALEDDATRAFAALENRPRPRPAVARREPVTPPGEGVAPRPYRRATRPRK